MEHIQLLIENWSVILAAICIVIVSVQKILAFISLPTEKQEQEIKARLLEWVRSAEEDLKSGTGKFKLAQVYDLFCQQYPQLKKWYSLEQFDKMVGEALEIMQKELDKSRAAKVNALKLGE